MSEIEIKERHFSSFFRVPFVAYGERFPFVSPLKSDLSAMLDPKKNPFWKQAEGTFYTALRAGEPIGRIVAHVHHAANERFGESCGSFGFFDCVDDQEVAKALLSRAEDFARDQDCTRIRGNMNLSANQEIGVLVEGEQHAPFLAQIYNPAYIPALLEGAGYVPVHPMTSFVNRNPAAWDADAFLADKHRALRDDPEYVFRSFERARFDDEVESIRLVLNDAMASNYLFVPLSEEEARFQLGPLKLVMDTELVRIAEHEGEVVGVAMGVPNVNPLLQKMQSRLFPFGWWHFLRGRSRLREASIIIILVKTDYQSKGVIRLLTADLMKAAVERGYTAVGGTWIGDDNPRSRKSAEAIGMEPLHRVDMFEKKL